MTDWKIRLEIKDIQNRLLNLIQDRKHLDGIEYDSNTPAELQKKLSLQMAEMYQKQGLAEQLDKWMRNEATG